MTDYQRQGWVRFYRKSIDSSVWKNPIIWMVWSWCLLKSNHQINTFPFNGEDIEIKDGQFITGRIKATQEIPISEQQYRTSMKYLEKTKRLTIKTTNKFSLITVLKWEQYQKDNQQTNQPLTNQQPATNQPLTTNKNDKNVKKSSEPSSEPEPPFNLPIELDKLKESSRKDLRLVRYYFRRRKMDLPTKAIFQKEMRRALAEIKTLKDYEDKKIISAFDYAEAHYPEWTIETVGKTITKI